MTTRCGAKKCGHGFDGQSKNCCPTLIHNNLGSRSVGPQGPRGVGTQGEQGVQGDSAAGLIQLFAPGAGLALAPAWQANGTLPFPTNPDFGPILEVRTPTTGPGLRWQIDAFGTTPQNAILFPRVPGYVTVSGAIGAPTNGADFGTVAEALSFPGVTDLGYTAFQSILIVGNTVETQPIPLNSNVLVRINGGITWTFNGATIGDGSTANHTFQVWGSYGQSSAAGAPSTIVVAPGSGPIASQASMGVDSTLELHHLAINHQAAVAFATLIDVQFDNILVNVLDPAAVLVNDVFRSSSIRNTVINAAVAGVGTVISQPTADRSIRLEQIFLQGTFLQGAFIIDLSTNADSIVDGLMSSAAIARVRGTHFIHVEKALGGLIDVQVLLSFDSDITDSHVDNILIDDLAALGGRVSLTGVRAEGSITLLSSTTGDIRMVNSSIVGNITSNTGGAPYDVGDLTIANCRLVNGWNAALFTPMTFGVSNSHIGTVGGALLQLGTAANQWGGPAVVAADFNGVRVTGNQFDSQVRVTNVGPCNIVGNLFLGVGAQALDVAPTVGTSNANVVIANNQVRGNADPSFRVQSSYSVITGNIEVGIGTSAGIVIGGDHNVISGNVINNDFVVLAGSGGNHSISGNIVKGPNGMNLNATGNNIIESNKVVGPIAVPYITGVVASDKYAITDTNIANPGSQLNLSP